MENSMKPFLNLLQEKLLALILDSPTLDISYMLPKIYTETTGKKLVNTWSENYLKRILHHTHDRRQQKCP